MTSREALPGGRVVRAVARLRGRFVEMRQNELGSPLLGGESESPRRRRIRVQSLLAVSLLASNGVGFALTVSLVFFVLPGPDLLTGRFLVPTTIVGPVYVAVATVVGTVCAVLRGRKALRWSVEGRDPDEAERTATLGLPWFFTVVQAALWAGGAVVFTASFGAVDAEAVPSVGFTTTFAGLVVCCAAFLFAEFGLRPLSAVVLADGGRRRSRFSGAMTRVRVIWALGNGIPLLGLVIVALYARYDESLTGYRLALVIIVLGVASMVVGFALTSMLAGSLLDPVRSVRRAMDDVASGDLARRVVVYDGTELGDLQRGFNRMASGLQERDRLRDLFGRHVGYEVARAAEAAEPELGGRACRVGVVFVDVVGSTEMATDADPADVVDVLNAFFEVVVQEVAGHGGLVDKFLGDAALAVFGAPTPLEDPAASALACARRVAAELPLRVPELRAGVGVSYGDVVAGYVGSHSRFEYTVVGDAVNEASRLCELAKERPQLVLASGRALDAARRETESEADRWREVGSQVVRGRHDPTRLAVPRD